MKNKIKKKKIVSTSREETIKIGEKTAKDTGHFNIISLEGELGSGKTTFAKGFALGLLLRKKIKSPTFVIMKKYSLPTKFYNFYHFDCYRINSSKEILDLDWKKIIKNQKNIILVEWGNKIKKILPKETIKIKFKFIKENIREITIS